MGGELVLKRGIADRRLGNVAKLFPARADRLLQRAPVRSTLKVLADVELARAGMLEGQAVSACLGKVASPL